MTTYYEVLRPVTQDDLDAQQEFSEILKLIPPRGYVTFERFKHVGKKKAGRGIAYACSRGILKRIGPYDQVLKLDSVRFWCTQLNESGFKNLAPENTTKQLYLRGISRLNDWLPGRSFQSYKTVMLDGQITRQGIKKSFANVEELMNYCIESDHGTKAAQRVMREFLADPQMTAMSASSYTKDEKLM